MSEKWMDGSKARVTRLILIGFALLFIVVSAAWGRGAAEPTRRAGVQDEMVIGWIPPDVTGVCAFATEYFERAAEDARRAGLNVRITTQSPATHVDFGDQVRIIEDMVARRVNAIGSPPTEVEVVIPALRLAAQEGIPVIVVNLLEPIQGVEGTSYVGFSNVDTRKNTKYTKSQSDDKNQN